MSTDTLSVRRLDPPGFAPSAQVLFNALPHPVLAVSAEGRICDVNVAAETFFQLGRNQLLRLQFEEIVPFGSPLLSALEHALTRGAVVNKYRVDIGTPRIGA